MPGTNCGSQTYFVIDANVLHSGGSFGRIGMSDMDTALVVAMRADWAVNAEPRKFEESRARGLAIINALRCRFTCRVVALKRAVRSGWTSGPIDPHHGR